MTDPQTMEIATLAKDLLPRTTDAQAALLRKAVAPYEFAAVKEILQAFALSDEEQRLNLPRVMGRVTRAPRRSHAAEVDQHAERLREKALAKRHNAETVERARAFCAAHADQLDLWRMQAIAESPGLAFHRRPVLESTALCCAIHARFSGAGARPRIPGGTANPPDPAGHGDAGRGRGDVAARGRARAPRPNQQPFSRSQR